MGIYDFPKHITILIFQKCTKICGSVVHEEAIAIAALAMELGINLGNKINKLFKNLEVSKQLFTTHRQIVNGNLVKGHIQIKCGPVAREGLQIALVNCDKMWIVYGTLDFGEFHYIWQRVLK